MADTTKEIDKREIAAARIFRSKKLAIWDTRTFKPIINHDDLEPIMATLGFVAIPSFPSILPAGGSSSPATATSTLSVFVKESTWKDAKFTAAAKSTAAAPVTTWKEYIYSAGGRFLSAADSPPAPRPCLPYPRIDGLHIASYTAFLDAINFYLKKDDDLSDIFHIRGMPLNPAEDQNKVWVIMDIGDFSHSVYCDGTLDQEMYEAHDARIKYKDSSNLINCKMVLLKDIIPDIAGEHDSPSP